MILKKNINLKEGRGMRMFGEKVVKGNKYNYWCLRSRELKNE